MSKKGFQKPEFEVVCFDKGVIATSSCPCYDEFFCPNNYTNCTADGAGCECQINHVAGTANCTPCDSYNP